LGTKLINNDVISKSNSLLYFEIQKTLEGTFKEKFHVVFADLSTEGKRPSNTEMRKLMFGDFLRPMKDPNKISTSDPVKNDGEVKYYNEIKDEEALVEVGITLEKVSHLNAIY